MTPDRTTILISILVLSLSGCVGGLRPEPLTPERAAVYEPIWYAVLASLREEGSPAELDRDLPRLLDSSAARLPEIRFALRERRDSGLASYRREWLQEVLRDRLVDSVCAINERSGCGGSTLTSFVTLGDPRVAGDTAEVEVIDATYTPAECDSKDGGGFVGSHFRTVTLVNPHFGWSVVGSRLTMTGSGFCGEMSKDDREHLRRFERLRRRVGPLAGTYRYVVTLEGGDSVVVFGRTSRRMRSGINHRTLAEVEAEGAAIARGETPSRTEDVGYYLDGECSAFLGEAGGPVPRTIDCHHAFTFAPVFRSRDSTVWRGESGAETAAWILMGTSPIANRMRAAFSDAEYRSPDWYFFPGHWVRERNGRVRFRQDLVHEGRVLLSIRGDRISQETLGDE